MARPGPAGGAVPPPDRRLTAWPCRCPCPGTPASSRRKRVLRRPASEQLPSPAPICPTQLPRRGRDVAVPSDGHHRDAAAPRRAAGDGDEVAQEVMRGGSGDEDIGEGAHRERFRGCKVDELVLTRTAREHRWVALARTLDDNLFDASDARLVLAPRRSLHDH